MFRASLTLGAHAGDGGDFGRLERGRGGMAENLCANLDRVSERLAADPLIAALPLGAFSWKKRCLHRGLIVTWLLALQKRSSLLATGNIYVSFAPAQGPYCDSTFNDDRRNALPRNCRFLTCAIAAAAYLAIYQRVPPRMRPAMPSPCGLNDSCKIRTHGVEA